MKKATGICIAFTVLFLTTLGINAVWAQVYSWTHLNGPFHSSVITIKMAARDTLYASTLKGNYESDDNGQTWTYLSTPDTSAISGVVITSFVQTGQGRFVLGDFTGNVYLSGMGGNQWKAYSINTGASVSSLDAKGNNLIAAGTFTGVYVSPDTGKTWIGTTIMAPTSSVRFADDSLLVATTGSFPVTFSGNVNVSPNGTVAVSADSGKTWMTKSFTGMPASDFAEDTTNGIWYASFMNGGIKKSTDQGKTWSDFAMKDSSVNRILVTKDGMLFASTMTGLYKYDASINKMVSIPFNGAIITTMTGTPDGSIILGTTDLFGINDEAGITGKRSGIFTSSDQGATWKLTGTGNPTIGSISSDSHNRIYAGDLLGGLYTSSDEGMTWNEMNDGITPSAGIYTIKVKNDSLIALYGVNGAVAVSSDTGRTWNVVGDSMKTMLYGINNFCFTSDGNILASSNVESGSTKGGVIESKNMGKTWSLLSLNDTKVNYVIEADGMYFAGSETDLFRSKDQGKTWNSIKANLPGNLTSVAVSCLYETKSGTLIVTTDFGIYFSTDDGDTWTAATMASGSSINLTDVMIRKIAEDTDHQLFAITYGSGVLISMDSGQTWQQSMVDQNMSSQDNGFSITVDSHDHVFAAYTNGIYEAGNLQTAIETNPGENKPRKFKLEQNYPNPFNPTTIIPFQLNEAGRVSLTIYNMIGQKVATLIDERMSAGRHTVQFDASKMSSGVYFYQLHSGIKIVTRKMTLIK